jgi:hypothetical protein
MCVKNTYLNRFYLTANVDSLVPRTGHGYPACSPSTISVKDDCQHIHGVSGANS